MKTAEELESMFGISSERVAQIDEDASRGVLQGKRGATVVGPGRPPMFETAMQQVTFKAPQDRVEAMDERAEKLGIRRSDYLRRLVENDLRCAGVF